MGVAVQYARVSAMDEPTEPTSESEDDDGGDVDEERELVSSSSEPGRSWARSRGFGAA